MRGHSVRCVRGGAGSPPRGRAPRCSSVAHLLEPAVIGAGGPVSARRLLAASSLPFYGMCPCAPVAFPRRPSGRADGSQTRSSTFGGATGPELPSPSSPKSITSGGGLGRPSFSPVSEYTKARHPISSNETMSGGPVFTFHPRLPSAPTVCIGACHFWRVPEQVL